MTEPRGDQLPEIRIDRQDERPIFLQIVEEVERLAARGLLPPGSRMPPTRDLARQLGVNRNTVVSAYQELEARGRTSAHTGRGTFLRGPEASEESLRWEETMARAADGRALQNTLDLHSVSVEGADISFATNFPPQDHLPVESFRTVLDEVLRDQGAKVLTYGSPAGYLPLRRWIASQMDTPVRGEDVIITTGSQQAIDLVARALLNPGDTVAAEEPGFPGALSAFQVHGTRVVGLHADAHGPRTGSLERALARTRPKLLYLVPNFHNPTGVVMSLERRREILELADRHGLPVLEDDSAGALRFQGEPVPSLLALDRNDRTIYISTFSKKLLPGLRVGWMCAPAPVRDRAVALKQLTDCSTSLLLQAALHEFCRRGLLEEHLTRVTREYRKRRDAMIAAMGRHFPPWARWTEPDGGLILWVTLPEGMDARDLLVEVRSRGVAFNPGELFYADSPRRNHLRLTFGATTPEQIDKGIRLLGEILSNHDGSLAGGSEPSRPEAVPLV